MEAARPAALLVLFCLSTLSASDPRAKNVTWKSTNFKTILSWEPKPPADYLYTVEFSMLGHDRQRSVLCSHTTATTCDLSSFLTQLNATYTADVLSEPTQEDLGIIEPPYTASSKFCPYSDTDIGKPDFKLEVSEDKKKTTLHVTNPLTALFKDGEQLNIRDIFGDKLQYRVTYRRNKSTGKKTINSKTDIIELTTLDKGESYCFQVQAYIPSRSINKQLGDLSVTKCTKGKDLPFFETISVGVIATAIFFTLLLIGIIIAIIVVCCKCLRNAQKNGKEKVPLHDV